MGKILGETGRDWERLEKWGQAGQQVIFSYFKYNLKTYHEHKVI